MVEDLLAEYDELDEDPKPSRFGKDPGRWVVGLVLGLTTLGVFSLLSPELMFTSTLPTFGDLGAHVYPLHEFVDRLLPSWVLAGWSHGWYGGMPLFRLYFPLPAYVVAALAPLAGFEIAVKLMVAIGPLTLPVAAYAVLRSTEMSRWKAGAGAVVGSMFLLMTSYSIHGGNLLSTYMGEFAYSISFSLSLFYLAVVVNAGRSGNATPFLASVLLSLTALSHILTTVAVVAVTVPLLFEKRYGRTIFTSWVLGFLLSAFWSFPFLARLSLSSEPWHLYDPTWTEALPLELWPFIPMALVGIWMSGRDRSVAILPLLLLPVVACVFYAWPHGVAHRMRLMPYAFFTIHALAGVAVGAALEAAFKHRSRVAIGLATAAVWGLIGFNVLRSPDVVRERVAVANAGYEAAEGWDEYSAIVDSIKALPPGRLFWEESQRTYTYGSALALTIMPYWSPDHPVLGGLWINSSITYPFELIVSHEVGDSTALIGDRFRSNRPFDFDQGIEHARVLGGRYFLAFSEDVRGLADAHSELTRVATGDDWNVYEVARINMVATASRTPVVYPGANFEEVALRWFDSVPEFEPWVVAEGPLEWPQIDDSFDLSVSESLDTRPGVITDLVFDSERISFTTDAVGVPHLVRTSYFPNWVSVGATGPFRAAPSFMVVVPTTENVELVYIDTWAEWVGRALTFMGLLYAMLIAGRGNVARRPRRRRRGKQSMPSYGRR